MTVIESRIDAVLRRALLLLAAILPIEQRQWADALIAELQAGITARERVAMALSGALGLVAIAAERRAARYASNAAILITAAALGLLTGAVDLLSESRLPLLGALLASGIIAGAAAPHVSGLSGVLIGLGVPLVAAFTGFPAPYAFDRGDVWIPLLPAIALTALSGWVKRQSTGTTQ